MKLKIKKVIPETVMIYHDEYGFIGEANEYEFNYLRIDIKKHQLEGYYILKDNYKYYIEKNGILKDWNFFSLFNELLEEILDI